MAPGKTITRLEAQKKSKNRVSVFLDGEFAFGLDLATLAKFNFKKGDVLDEDRISDILLSEERNQVKESAIRYLAGRAHSEFELRTKLLRKDYSETTVSLVLAELKEAGFVDDVVFARTFAHNRMVSKPMGERLLRQELWAKGVSEAVIRQTVAETYSKFSEGQIALDLLRQRQPRYRDAPPQEQKKKLYDFLLRRGFDWQTVEAALNEVQE